MYSRVYYHFVSFYSSFFISFFFFFNDTATTEIYTLSLHDALPILFKRSQEQVGYRIVEQAAAHARQIGAAVEQHGQTRVEQVLDAALALEAHIDPIQLLRRDRYPQYVEAARPVQESGFQKRFENLPGSA